MSQHIHLDEKYSVGQYFEGKTHNRSDLLVLSIYSYIVVEKGQSLGQLQIIKFTTELLFERNKREYSRFILSFLTCKKEFIVI